MSSTCKEVWQIRPDEFVRASLYRDWLLAGYDRSTRYQNLTQPATHMPAFPAGTWRIDDEDWNGYGYAVHELRWLQLDDLEPTETAWKYERRHYVDRYAEWRREGLVPPPIEVVETVRRRLRIINGHRRWAAARELDVLVPAWVSPIIEVEGLGKVGLTYELSIIEALAAGEDVPQENVDFLRSRIEEKPALEKIVAGGPIYDVTDHKAA